ncbi:hypothetical protein ACKWTF_010649 [Chironomus riparius]
MGSASNKNQNGICIKSNTAHLISLGNSRLSTEVTLFEILGNLTIGAGDSCDIVLKGAGILDVHCRCSRKEVTDGEKSDENLGDVTITPFESAKVYVEERLLISNDEYVLQQGDVIRLGESVLLRFNFPAKAAILKSNAMEHNKKTISDNYEVLKKNLNTNCVNFTEFSNSSDKTLNNNVKITDKMKNLKMKGNDSYPKISNLQVFPVTSKSIENCSNLSNGTANNNIDEMQQLEDVLKMFVEYNNNNGCSSSEAVNQSSRNNILQTSSEKINITHQNRIKTNGSLPKNFNTKDHAQNHFEFYESESSRATDDIEVYKKPQSPRTRIKTFVSSPTSNSSTKSLSPTDNNDKSYEYDKNSTSNEKDYEKLIRSFEEKFRMDIYNIQHCENLNHIDVRSNIADNNNLHSNNSLNGEKNEILAKIRELKILISDIQFQESETFLESDVEKSLVWAEMSNEKTNLALLNEKLQAIKAKMKQLEMTRLKRQKQQEIQQIKLKNTIKDKEAEIKMLEEQKGVSIKTESRLDELQESLESDIKTYEDLEFHYLEEETDWASLMEEYKENISMFTKQIEDKKNYIHQLEQTSRDNESSTQNDQKTLETKLFNLKQKLENEREKLKNIDKILSSKIAPVTEPNSIQISNNNTSSAFDGDKSFNNSIVATSSDIMSKSFNENMFFNRSKIEVSYFDFSMTTESLPRNSKIVPNSSPERKQVVSATTPKRVMESDLNDSPLMMPKYHSLSSINYVNDNNNSQKKVIVPIMNGNVKNDENRQRPSTSSSSSSSSRNAVQLRTLPKQKRPLTQFLPNFQLDFNLRKHIETAGHQIQLCPHIIIDGKSFVIRSRLISSFNALFLLLF